MTTLYAPCVVAGILALAGAIFLIFTCRRSAGPRPPRRSIPIDLRPEERARIQEQVEREVGGLGLEAQDVWAGAKPDPLQEWPIFMERVRQRMEKGRNVYGDLSFHRPPAELQGEILEEMLDIAGWAYVLWRRVKDMEHWLQELEARAVAMAEMNHPVYLAKGAQLKTCVDANPLEVGP